MSPKELLQIHSKLGYLNMEGWDLFITNVTKHVMNTCTDKIKSRRKLHSVKKNSGVQNNIVDKKREVELLVTEAMKCGRMKNLTEACKHASNILLALFLDISFKSE